MFSELDLPDADRFVRKRMENAMSLCVVEPLLRSAFVSVGMLKEETPCRWSDGRAQCDSLYDAHGTFLPGYVISIFPAHVLRVVWLKHDMFSDTHASALRDRLISLGDGPECLLS